MVLDFVLHYVCVFSVFCDFITIIICYIHFEIRVLSVSHLMGLAAPGNVEHWLSIHLCGQTGHIHWVLLQTFVPHLSRPFSPSGAMNHSVCDRFDTGSCTLYMSRPFWAADCEGLPWYPQCQVLGLVKPRMFLGLWCRRSSRSWSSHCGGATAGQRHSIPTFHYRWA